MSAVGDSVEHAVETESPCSGYRLFFGMHAIFTSEKMACIPIIMRKPSA